MSHEADEESSVAGHAGQCGKTQEYAENTNRVAIDGRWLTPEEWIVGREIVV